MGQCYLSPLGRISTRSGLSLLTSPSLPTFLFVHPEIQYVMVFEGISMAVTAEAAQADVGPQLIVCPYLEPRSAPFRSVDKDAENYSRQMRVSIRQEINLSI